MKSQYYILLISIFMVICISGCSFGISDHPTSLDFTYEVQEELYAPGDCVTVRVTALNTGKAFKWKGPPEYCFYIATLSQNIGNGPSSFYSELDNLFCEVLTEKIYNKGTEFQGYYEFIIPEDAPPGSYNLSFSYMGIQNVFYDVISIENKDSD